MCVYNIISKIRSKRAVGKDEQELKARTGDTIHARQRALNE
jgi:hypothetical protein